MQLQIHPEELEIVLNPDGSKKLLGKGAHGEVRKAYLLGIVGLDQDSMG